jgi:UDP:flavonoid glycosyltransferase YjiC (YdhE family)
MSTFGSEGDFKPPVAIGKMLQQFGVDVDFIANPFFEQKVLSEGLNFIGAGPFLDLDTIFKNDPSLLHPFKGPGQIGKMILGSVEYFFPVACQQIEKQRPDIVVSHAIELGTQWAARKYGIPYVTLSTTPWIWFGRDDLVVVDKRLWPPGMNLVAFRVLAWIIESCFAVSSRKLRKRFQLPRGYGAVKSFFSESALNLGCWSALFRPETHDDPVNSLITGFTIERERDPGQIPKELMDWLSHNSSPVIVGLGTAARWQGRHIYQAVAAACAELKRRCLLIGPEPKDFEDSEDRIRAVREIPFQEVFPYASVLVHHGGLGTTAQALFAGCPQLVVPFAHDQFHNAARVKRLGAGLSLRSRKISEKSVKKLIRQMLNDHQMNQRAKDLALQFRQQPYGSNLAAKAILEVLKNEG